MPRPKSSRRPGPAGAPWSEMHFVRKMRIEADEEREVAEHVVEIWGNDRYTASVRRFPSGVMEISFHRHDRKPVRDWRHAQRIKNEIAGAEREAMELYPAESRKVDEANEYHLYVLPPGDRFPIGAPKRFVSDAIPPEYHERGARQRPEGEEFE